MKELKGTQKAKAYALGKSSSDVFRKAHENDFLAGYSEAKNDSFSHEALEVLQSILKEYDLGIVSGIDALKIRELIKKITS